MKKKKQKILKNQKITSSKEKYRQKNNLFF
jgi:hypothetical protein